MKTRWIIPVLGLLVFTGCAGPMPSASLTTAHPSWQHYFKLAYDVQQQGEVRTVSGYVINEYGEHMKNVQLLVQALSGEDLVSQRLTYVLGGVPAFGRSYFQLAGLPAADTYRVTVWSFERVERNSNWP